MRGSWLMAIFVEKLKYKDYGNNLEIRSYSF